MSESRTEKRRWDNRATLRDSAGGVNPAHSCPRSDSELPPGIVTFGLGGRHGCPTPRRGGVYPRPYERPFRQLRVGGKRIKASCCAKPQQKPELNSIRRGGLLGFRATALSEAVRQGLFLGLQGPILPWGGCVGTAQSRTARRLRAIEGEAGGRVPKPAERCLASFEATKSLSCRRVDDWWLKGVLWA